MALVGVVPRDVERVHDQLTEDCTMKLEQQEHYTEEELAPWLGVKTATLQRWRREGVGPKWKRSSLGVFVYAHADVDAWAEERMVTRDRGATS